MVNDVKNDMENARTTVIIISSIFGASIAIPALMGMLTINAVMTCFGLMCVASISSILIAWGIVTMIKNTIKREIDFDTMIGYWILACIGGGIGWTALNGQLVAEWIVIGYIFFFAVMLMIISMVVILLALVVNTVIDAIKEHARERVQEIKIEKCIVKNKH